MGDKNTNSGQAGSVGGRGNTANVGAMIQAGNDANATVNWGQMADELEKIHAEMEKERSDDPDHIMATGAVKAAGIAAKKGDGNKVIQYLKTVPEHILKYAQKAGLPLLIALIKQHTGIELPTP